MLNVSHSDPFTKIFEIVRVSYYLANHKAVVCELCLENYVEPDLQQVLRFASPLQLGECCDELIKNTELRSKYANDCFDIFRKRDVRKVIIDFFN